LKALQYFLLSVILPSIVENFIEEKMCFFCGGCLEFTFFKSWLNVYKTFLGKNVLVEFSERIWQNVQLFIGLATYLLSAFSYAQNDFSVALQNFQKKLAVNPIIMHTTYSNDEQLFFCVLSKLSIHSKP
jgi:hypothetical protein